MATEFLCRCNNCYSILLDENPNEEAIKKELCGIEKNMVQCEDEGGIFWACPECLTDDYLTDL